MISKESDFAKNDTIATDHHAKTIKPSSSTSWSRLKDPRIVRVSKAFGGKDRHSKVCTVRGLRDRRVRLSVPTAIQLYDLQDRLGLSQPSKVVDWLLNAAKHEIDELPPLQIPPGRFQQILAASQAEHKQSHDPLRQASRTGSIFGEKIRVCSGDRDHESVNNWGRNDEENQDGYNINFPSRETLTTLMMNMNNTISYSPSPFARFDPSSLSLSTHPQEADLHNFGFVPMSTVPSGSHQQVLVYQPGMSTQSYSPSQNAQFDPKEVNFQSSISSTVDHQHRHHPQPAVRPIHFMNMTASLLPSGNDEDSNDQQKGSSCI